MKHYVVFLCGLPLNSFGATLVTKSSPGSQSIIFSILLTLAQLIILHSKANKVQPVVSMLFDSLIDLTMLCLKFVNSESYPLRAIALLIGHLIFIFGTILLGNHQRHELQATRLSASSPSLQP